MASLISATDGHLSISHGMQVVSIMKQRIRRKQHDVEEGRGLIQTPFGGASQSSLEAAVSSPVPPIQAKRDCPTVLPQYPRRFDQIPLFPDQTPSSVQRRQDECSRSSPTSSPVQRLVIQHLRTPLGRPVHRGGSSPLIQQRPTHAPPQTNSWQGSAHNSSATLQAKDFSNSRELEQYQQQGISPIALLLVLFK